MEDIRRLSGASTGSIYHHFENKEMLAQALYLEGRSDLNASLLAAITGKPPREGIKDLIYAYLDWFEQHPDLGQFVMQAGQYGISRLVRESRPSENTISPSQGKLPRAVL